MMKMRLWTGITLTSLCMGTLALAPLHAAYVAETVEYSENPIAGFDTLEYSGRGLARDLNGRLWCAYQTVHEYFGTTQLQIRIAYSDDGGVTWTHQWLTGPEGPLWQAWPTATGSRQTNPILLVDGDNYVHIIWVGQLLGETAPNIHHAIHKPGPWDINYCVEHTVTGHAVDRNIGAPSAALDSQGRIHLAWSREFEDGSALRNMYYSVYSGGFIGSWSDPERLKPAPEREQLNPSVAVDTADRVFIVYYIVKDNWSYEVKLLVNLDTVETIANASGFDYYPSIAADTGGNIHIAWIRGETSLTQLCYRLRDASGLMHDEEVVNTGGKETILSPSIATDRDGNVYVVAQGSLTQESAFSILLAQKFANDTAWEQPVTLAPFSAADSRYHRSPRILGALWPMSNGDPVDIPKHGYALLYNYYRVPASLGNAVKMGKDSHLTWLGQDYAELTIVPPTSGGFTYAPNEQVTLQWRVYPSTFTGLKSSTNIYFGLWADPNAGGYSIKPESLAPGGRVYLYEEARVWKVLGKKPRHAWKGVVFPLPGDVTSGTLSFIVPTEMSNMRWSFIIAIQDSKTGAFIASPEIATSQYFWVE